MINVQELSAPFYCIYYCELGTYCASSSINCADGGFTDAVVHGECWGVLGRGADGGASWTAVGRPDTGVALEIGGSRMTSRS